MSQREKKWHAESISHHYDVGNDFYALFLDPLMVYTCAYYRDPDGKLEQAQMDKLDLVCRKLRLDARRDHARHRLRLGRAVDLGRPALRRARARGDPRARAGGVGAGAHPARGPGRPLRGRAPRLLGRAA